MAFRNRLQRVPVEKLKTIIIDIDPTDPHLSDVHRRFMDKLFLAEEKKHGLKGIYKRKKWEKNKLYKIGFNFFIRFPSHEVNRRPKRYAIVIVGPNDVIPDFEKRKQEKEKQGVNLLYLKKNSEGFVEVCAASDDEPHTLTETQSQELIAKQLFDQPETRIIRRTPETQKMISDIQVLTGYHYYLYQATKLSDKPEAEGGFSNVNTSSGKLKFVGEGESRKTEFKPGKPTITKQINVSGWADAIVSFILKYARKELDILSVPALKARLGTKGGATIQKDKDGNVTSITLVQGKMPGRELFELSRNLVISQRFKAARLLVQAVNNDHLAGIAHRDIKSENVMLHIDPNTNAMEFNLVDYGFAERVEDIKQSEELCGTPPFISPEMVVTGLGDQQSDGYATGMQLRDLFKDTLFGKMARMEVEDLKALLYKRYKTGASLERPSCPMLDSLKKLGGVEKERAELYERIMYEMTLTDRSKRMTPATARSEIEAFEATCSSRKKIITRAEKKQPPFFDYLETAWDETYLRDFDPVKRKNARMAEFFFGWPGKKGGGAWASYLLGGFLLTPLKNLIKLTEFAVKAFSQGFLFAADYLEALHPLTEGKQALWKGCYLMHALFALAGWLVSGVTSPMVNARAGLKETGSEVVGYISLMITVAVYAAIFVVVPPVIIPCIALTARGLLSEVLETCWNKPRLIVDKKRLLTELESPRYGFWRSTTTSIAKTLHISPVRASTDKRPVTQLLPISQDFAADPHPFLSAPRRDTQVAASGLCKQSGPVSGRLSASR